MANLIACWPAVSEIDKTVLWYEFESLVPIKLSNALLYHAYEFDFSSRYFTDIECEYKNLLAKLSPVLWLI